MEGMAKLPPAFEAGGVITAGNASAVVDCAAAMVLGLETDAETLWLEASVPHRRLWSGRRGSADHGNRPGSGDAKGSGKSRNQRRVRSISSRSTRLLRRKSLACVRDFEKMGIDPEKVNPMGNAIALGASARRHRRHPDPHVRVCSAPESSAVRSGHDVHRRRPGYRFDPGIDSVVVKGAAGAPPLIWRKNQCCTKASTDLHGFK